MQHLYSICNICNCVQHTVLYSFFFFFFGYFIPTRAKTLLHYRCNGKISVHHSCEIRLQLAGFISPFIPPPVKYGLSNYFDIEPNVNFSVPPAPAPQKVKHFNLAPFPSDYPVGPPYTHGHAFAFRYVFLSFAGVLIIPHLITQLFGRPTSAHRKQRGWAGIQRRAQTSSCILHNPTVCVCRCASKQAGVKQKMHQNTEARKRTEERSNMDNKNEKKNRKRKRERF